MRRVERRRLRVQWVVGALLTIIAVFADLGGSFGSLEQRLYNWRAEYCQHFVRPPADMAHVDIDDESLKVLGQWPWDRQTVAALVDELYAAGAKTVALDIIFPES